MEKMRVSFDLDEVLFVSPELCKTEPELHFPWNRIYKERLRLGTPTSSFRSEAYIRKLFRCYGVKFDGIVNGTRHLKEVQKGSSQILPQKVPSRYRIALHVDDETVICSYGREFGFEAYQLDAPDDQWKEKVIARAEEVKRKWERRMAEESGS